MRKGKERLSFHTVYKGAARLAGYLVVHLGLFITLDEIADTLPICLIRWGANAFITKLGRCSIGLFFIYPRIHLH
jgi:hypothetical protein